MPSFRGKNACSCLVAWLPVYEAQLLERGVIKQTIDIYQLIGNATASANTHSQGGCYDIAQYNAVAIEVAREMGAAGFPRDAGFDTEHQHGVLKGCPHNGPAAYQIAALEAGYNGLGSGGRGGRDTGPLAGTRLRTWREGIAWAQAQAKPPVLDLTVATVNVQEIPRHDKTILEDLETIDRSNAKLVLWQELGNPFYFKQLAKLKRLASKVVAPDREGYNSPISYDPGVLDAISATAKKFQPATKGVSLTREITTVRFFIRGKGHMKLVAHSAHFVPRAWKDDGSARPRAKRAEALQQPLRQGIWKVGQVILRRKIKRIAKTGIPQVLGTDTNRKRVPVLPKKMAGRRVQAVSHGVDWLFFIDGKDHVWELVGSSWTKPLDSDHDALLQRAHLIPKKK